MALRLELLDSEAVAVVGCEFRVSPMLDPVERGTALAIPGSPSMRMFIGSEVATANVGCVAGLTALEVKSVVVSEALDSCESLSVKFDDAVCGLTAVGAGASVAESVGAPPMCNCIAGGRFTSSGNRCAVEVTAAGAVSGMSMSISDSSSVDSASSSTGGTSVCSSSASEKVCVTDDSCAEARTTDSVSLDLALPPLEQQTVAAGVVSEFAMQAGEAVDGNAGAGSVGNFAAVLVCERLAFFKPSSEATRCDAERLLGAELDGVGR